jgi:proteic killer suppression protein
VKVEVTRRAEKSLAKAPRQAAVNFFTWKREVEEHGLEIIRKIPGYHDEPLEGKLKGKIRSIRLGLGYRAFYRVVGSSVKCVFVEEVNKHDYKAIERLFGL